MQGRDSYRLDPATSIQEQKYGVSRTTMADCLCLKCHLSISFSKEMVGLFVFLFVRMSFSGVSHSENIKKSDIKIFNSVPISKEKYKVVKV